jgi:hypothetical protein
VYGLDRFEGWPDRATSNAQFITPNVLSALGAPLNGNAMTLITLRSNDQFITTIYGFDDRLRGLKGSRNIVLVSPEDMAPAVFLQVRWSRLKPTMTTVWCVAWRACVLRLTTFRRGMYRRLLPRNERAGAFGTARLGGEYSGLQGRSCAHGDLI